MPWEPVKPPPVWKRKLEDNQRQLKESLDEYTIHAHSTMSALTAELEKCKTERDNAVRDLEEAHGRINDLQSINNNLTAIKNKLETELSTVQADLDQATKEANTASAVEQPHEEQEHSMKIKSLEEQVKQLQVQIQQQEAEAAAAMGQHTRQTNEPTGDAVAPAAADEDEGK